MVKDYNKLIMSFGMIVAIGFIFLSFLLFMSFYRNSAFDIYYTKRAYDSVTAVCSSTTFEEVQQKAQQQGYYLAGYYSPSDDNITILDPNDSTVMKHELCHRRQAKQGRLYSGCNNKILSMLDEIECYVAENQ